MFHHWLVSSDHVKHFIATINNNWESMQLHICQWVLFRQIVRLKEDYEKKSFLVFHCIIYRVKRLQFVWNIISLKSGTYNLHCSWWHKFKIKALLCNNRCFYTVDSDMWLSNTNTQRIHYCIYTAKRLRAGAMFYILSLSYGYESGSQLEAWIWSHLYSRSQFLARSGLTVLIGKSL